MSSQLLRTFCACTLLACLLVPAARLARAGDGLPKAIVTVDSPGPFEAVAATYLAQGLRKLYGQAVPLNPKGVELSPKLTDVILVGAAAVEAGAISKAELEKLKPDGFVVRSKGGRVALAGYRQSGTQYAASALLEKLGYRYYPGKVVVEKPAAASIPEMDFSDKPFFAYRTIYAWQLGGSVRDEMMGDPLKAENPEIFNTGQKYQLFWQHNTGYLVPAALYFEEHPEYFSLKTDGTRYRAKGDSYQHICLSHPDVIRIATQRLLKWIELQPQRRYFWIHVGDGSEWCQCKRCKAMDVFPGNYSDRLLTWANQLARAVKKKYPDKTLVLAAYCGTELAPVKARPESNLLIFYCPYWGVALGMNYPMTAPCNAEALKQFNGWHKVAGDQMALYDYNMGYVCSWDAMAEKIQWAAKKGLKGVYLCGRPSNFKNLFVFMTSKLLWDPSLDPEALKKEFVGVTYGPAAPHVMEYLTLIKNRLQQGSYPRGVHDRTIPAEFYDDGVYEKGVALFDKMIEAAAGDERLSKALAAEKKLFVQDRKRAVAIAKRRAVPTPPTAEPEKIENGVRIPAAAFEGGFPFKEFSWQTPTKRENVRAVYAAQCARPHEMRAAFELDAPAGGAATLKIEAQGGDKDLKPDLALRITINCQGVFEGEAGFIKRGWSWETFPIPKGVLRKGKNVIQIENVSPSPRIDHFWCMIVEARILLE